MIPFLSIAVSSQLTSEIIRNQLIRMCYLLPRTAPRPIALPDRSEIRFMTLDYPVNS